MSLLKDYINIYIWRLLAFVLNIISMFIVVPFLTSSPTIYGIYSFCVSINVFLTYGDLGFLKSSQKFAAECYAKNKNDDEKSHLGLSLFILTVIVTSFTLILVLLSFEPTLLLKDVSSSIEVNTASQLLFITGLFAFQFVLQRAVEVVYSVRLKDYIFIRINLMFNVLKIISVFYFFRNESYNIVGYFLFVQVISVLASIISMIIANKLINYSFITLIKNVRFKRDIFIIEKDLAFSTLFISIIWILYYEIDVLVIGKYFGVSEVALYSVSLIFLTLFRNVFSIIYSPMLSRMNHFVGLENHIGLRTYVLNVVRLTSPVVLISIVSVFILLKPIILSWVGDNYVESIQISRFFVLCNILAFISYPTSNLLMSLQKIKELYYSSSLLPIVYWLGIYITYEYIGLQSFGVFKFSAFLISGIVYFGLLKKMLQISSLSLFITIFKHSIFPVLYVIVSSVLLLKYLPTDLSHINLVVNISVALLNMLIAMLILFFTTPEIRKIFFNLFKRGV